MNSDIEKLREIAFKENRPILRQKSYELLMSEIKKRKPNKILEIGVNNGLSGLSMLLESENSFLTGIEIDEDNVIKAKENYKKFGVEGRAKIFLGDASEIIPILTGKYDFIFLDGPKGHYFEYVPYLINALNVNGVLFADNILFRGYVEGVVKAPRKYSTTKHSMQNFIKFVTTEKNLKTQIYHIEDGVSITEKLYE